MPERTGHWRVLLLAVGAVAVTPVTARAQSLEDAMVSAYLTRPELQADRARQRALDEDVARAVSGWRPQVTVSGQYGIGKDRLAYGYLNPPQSVKETINPTSYAVQLTQPIYDGGKTAADVDRAKSAVKGGLAHDEAVEESVLADAIQHYFDLYRDQDILGLAEKNVAALQDELKVIQARFNRQDATVADLQQAQTRLALGLAQRAAAAGAVAASRSSFKQVTGLQPIKLAPPPPLPVALLPATRDAAVILAVKGPSVREAVQAIKTAQEDVKGAESALKPVLSLQLLSEYQSDVSQGQFKTTYSEVLGNLQIPLYMGGADYARTREAKTVVGQRRFEADEAREQAIDRVTRAWEELGTVRERIGDLQNQVAAANKAWHAMQTEVKVGYREIIDELNAEQEFFNAEIALVQARHDEAIATFSVLSWSGLLTARILKLPVMYYDPSVNYKAESHRWFGTGIPDNDDVRPASSR
ncbi:MAG TPA: TolC family outer membrane protein [Xanthobacteraceae bacterium]|jgi:outer membrane protein|nr:TolC family outer membrane protein [Xanthobacteraceae bacterium]